MSAFEGVWHSYWWLLFLFLVIFCCLGMRGRMGSGCCGSSGKPKPRPPQAYPKDM